MTEEEAKTKWCPQIRFDAEGCINREDQNLDFNCMGSGCMMWAKDTGLKFVKSVEGGDIYKMPDETEGHCGLVK